MAKNPSPGRPVIVAGTGTDVGKTIVTAALAARLRDDGHQVGVCKPVQTGLAEGQAGDADHVAHLSGTTDTAEFHRLPDPLAPETAARLAGRPQLALTELATEIAAFTDKHDITLIEGAGGVLVRLGTDLTILDVARALAAPIVVVARPGLGTLNDTELTVRAITAAGAHCAGIVIGAMPEHPDLATRCNLVDLPRLTHVPLLGQVPAGAGTLTSLEFQHRAPGWFTSTLTGHLSVT